MPFTQYIGHRAELTIGHISRHGAHLALDDDPDGPMILLLGSEIPEDAKEGDVLDVFIYLDSEDRPIATTATPALMLDEVAFLPVMDVNAHGAFVDWGLPKELLVPFAEQTHELRVGERIPIGLQLDRSDRLVGSMRVSRMLTEPEGLEAGQWIDGVAWRNDPEIGLFAILQRQFVGLVPHYEAHKLRRGDHAQFRVARLLDDGKCELSLRPLAKQAASLDGKKILAALASPQPPRINDRSSPEQILVLFGISKKAFKRAVGGLLKQRLVQFDQDGFLITKTTRP